MGDAAEAYPTPAATAAAAHEGRLYGCCLMQFTRSVSARQLSRQPDWLVAVLPRRVLADVYLQLSVRDDMRDFLRAELCDLERFLELLRHGFTWTDMIGLLSNLINHNRDVPAKLADNFALRTDSLLTNPSSTTTVVVNFATDSPASPDASSDSDAFIAATNPATIAAIQSHIAAGLQLGAFFGDAGWWQHAITILRATSRLIRCQYDASTAAATTSSNQSDASSPPKPAAPLLLLLTHLHCLARLLHAESRYFEFPSATRTLRAGNQVVERLGVDSLPAALRCQWFAAMSVQYFARSDYDNSQRWGIEAVRQISSRLPAKLCIDVLRQTAKACVLKRHFQRARMLLVQAIKIAKQTFGRRHYKYADALMDFAFYLLNVDSIKKSVGIYKEALKCRQAVLGQRSLHVAIAQEDLAYALYVHNYSSGHFQGALDRVETAIGIMARVVPAEHLFVASAKRVKALILEEVALEDVGFLDHVAVDDERAANHELLLEAEELHRAALRLSLVAFGEENVQTAKHYGNLGRLYQSMTKYKDAEAMHNRAIRIKTDILGPDDFEVGLSIGHLASLYNYHMAKYSEAEGLYLRSIKVSLQLFGDAYSGLEYDYRGLCHVYEMLDDEAKFFEYHTLLEEWRLRRQQRDEVNAPMWDIRDESTLEEMTTKFFQLVALPYDPYSAQHADAVMAEAE